MIKSYGPFFVIFRQRAGFLPYSYIMGVSKSIVELKGLDVYNTVPIKGFGSIFNILVILLGLFKGGKHGCSQFNR
jgi:hypothetical protein